MKKLEFGYEDFYSSPIDSNKAAYHAKDIAQAKFDEWWKTEIESAARIYSTTAENWARDPKAFIGKSFFKAKVIMIEEIKKEPCKHESKSYGYKNCEPFATCDLCNVELIADWKAKANN